MSRKIRIGLAINHNYTFYRGALRGVARYAESKPHWLFSSIVLEEQTTHAVGWRRPEGLIASVHTPELARRLSAWRRPVVNIAAVLPSLKLPSVRVDNTPVGQMAADHFLERGLRHFAYLGPPDHQYSIERLAAFRQALQAAGRSVTCHHTPAHVPLDPLGRQWNLDQGVQDWLRKLPKPVGVFVPGDDIGVEVSEVCRQAGLRIPEDVALLGVDNDDLNCELARPRLSSVILPAERVGYEAAALLDRLLAGERPPAAPIFVPPLGIATRRSTEALAIEDPHVVSAVRYIREHAHLPLRVSDVLREVPVGRRTLELRFRKALGWGLGEEIRRTHIERAKRLLARTNLPLKAVALQAGFSDFRHMAVVFRAELGQTPHGFRIHMHGVSDGTAP